MIGLGHLAAGEQPAGLGSNPAKTSAMRRWPDSQTWTKDPVGLGDPLDQVGGRAEQAVEQRRVALRHTSEETVSPVQPAGTSPAVKMVTGATRRAPPQAHRVALLRRGHEGMLVVDGA